MSLGRLIGTAFSAASLPAVAWFAAAAVAAGSQPQNPLAAGAGPARAAARGLDVLPFPGTPDAPPGTPIDFPALPLGQVAAVLVTGSRTGVHRGRITAQPGHAGSQFAPDRAFAPGERVTVLARLRSLKAGRDSGAFSSTELRFSFSIARAAPAEQSGTDPRELGAIRDSGMASRQASASGGSNQSQPTTHSFVSRPDLHPPIVEMMERDTDRASGDIFLDAQNSGQNGPYILNPDGDLLWQHPTAGNGEGPSAMDARVQTYKGQPVLTYFQGRLIKPHYTGNGVGVMLNEHYQRIHTITAGAGYRRDGIDEHELSVTPQGTALVTVFAPVRADLRSVGGPANGTVLDSIVQEVDIATNRVVWEWSALAHVPLTDSYRFYRPGLSYDYFHVNSIQELPDGQVIISARHTWTVYSIDKRTGRIEWEVGGKHSDYQLGRGANFEWQHDARLRRHGLLTLFDDASAGAPWTHKESESRGLAIRLTPGRGTLVHAYRHVPHVLAGSQGSMQTVSSDNVFIGWGSAPSFSEYTQSGNRIFKAWFRYPVASYRAYRSNKWVGAPLSPPSVAVRGASTAGQDNIYASWNGATRVARWRVYAGASPSTLLPVRTVPWTSFETTIQTPAAALFKVQALDSGGHPLPHGTSSAVSGQS